MATWLKTNRENKYKRSKVVLPGYSGDYEGIINFSNTTIKTSSKTYTGAQYTPRIAGLIAGTPLTISATYAPLSEVIDCDRHTTDENDEKVNKGEFFIWYDGEKFKMSRAMNSLVTTTQGKLEAYQTIKSVDVMDAIYDDIKKRLRIATLANMPTIMTINSCLFQQSWDILRNWKMDVYYKRDTLP